MSEENGSKKVVLIAEDDDDHFLLTRDAFSEVNPGAELYWVKDGVELLDYLLRRGSYSQPGQSPRPWLILLDLNMPRKDGRQALQEIKANPALQAIPLVVLTTSRNEEDVHLAYSLGGSFIRKPVRLEQIVDVIRNLSRYWLETVEQPSLTPRERISLPKNP
ncbi:MAG TPA: response regulator [bacterium]|nr:response regulator [bacterium]